MTKNGIATSDNKTMIVQIQFATASALKEASKFILKELLDQKFVFVLGKSRLIWEILYHQNILETLL